MTAEAEWALARARIAESGGRIGTPLVIEARTTSTNDLAKDGARGGAPHGATWLAEEQTGGRGRQGRAWLSPRGENLLFSTLLRPTCRPERVPLTAIVTGVCVAEALAACGIDARVKWPNDVLVGKKKIAGILVEAVTRGRTLEAVVVGIGINVHTRELPEELRSIATSCALSGQGPWDRGALLADVLARLDRDIDHVLARGLGLVHARLSKLDALIGEPIEANGERGIARGIDDEGRLIFETTSEPAEGGTSEQRRATMRTVRMMSGEVHLRTTS